MNEVARKSDIAIGLNSDAPLVLRKEALRRLGFEAILSPEIVVQRLSSKQKVQPSAEPTGK